MKTSAIAFAAACLTTSALAAKAIVNPNGPFPKTTEPGQYGTNDCGTKDSKTSKCQNLWLNSIEDFCIYGPPKVETIGASERYAVAWCTKAGHGSRLIPKGTFKSVHWVETPSYIQITGKGDFTKINVPAGDDGGEMDGRGADGLGNPIGAVLFATYGGTKRQVIEWSQFLDHETFSIRVCKKGSGDAYWCPHIYDVMGSEWNHPGSYGSGFESCQADNVALPAGLYKVKKNGKTSTSTWYQGTNPTPAAQAPAKSSQCKSVKTISAAKYCKSPC